VNLRLPNLRYICALQSIDGADLNKSDHADRLLAYAGRLSEAEVTALIARLQTNDMPPREQQLERFTHRNLQKLSDWAVSRLERGFDSQPDQKYKDGALGLPFFD
jgi:hypothetical protein